MDMKHTDLETTQRKTGEVGLFFYVKGKLLLHSCQLEHAEKYGNFLVYPLSHNEIWERDYRKRYLVDYDYFPRGRIMFYTPSECFWLYRDTCIPDSAVEDLKQALGRVIEKRDEHYVCHRCGRIYVR